MKDQPKLDLIKRNIVRNNQYKRQSKGIMISLDMIEAILEANQRDFERNISFRDNSKGFISNFLS